MQLKTVLIHTFNLFQPNSNDVSFLESFHVHNITDKFNIVRQYFASAWDRHDRYAKMCKIAETSRGYEQNLLSL